MLGAMTVRALLAIALLPILGTVLTGCGTASAPSPPAGVDELVIPTPSPDPADFVDRVDNPWFPLEPGTRATYDVADAHGNHLLLVTVEPGPTVAGVPTTARVSRERGSRVVDWYAQDDRGNVWWFGRAGEWAAGTDGAEAGLAMAATPRVGDGYRTAYAKGVVEDTAEVVSVSGDQLVVEVRSPLRPGTSELTYERGTGLVTDQLVAAEYRVARLRR
jgi:hypothetical protein